MCLCAFLEGRQVTASERAELETGARALGAAFQKVNFLRDLAADFRVLGRSYFPGIRVDSFTEADKNRILDDIDADLKVSAAVVPRLPAGSRRAVALAQSLFTELASATARNARQPAGRDPRSRPGPGQASTGRRGDARKDAEIVSTAVVIGGGIGGLASAALLARAGYEVTLLEAHETLGGRAGSWEKDGFRFDTGPSWYLMPEVFDHFFRLLGTTAAEQLDLVTLDPGYRSYFEGVDEPIDISASRDENLEIFENGAQGIGRRLARYLDSAARTYWLARRYFLYTSFQSIRPLFARDVVSRLPKLGRLLLEPLWSQSHAHRS